MPSIGSSKSDDARCSSSAGAAQEQADAEALSAAVVFEDERKAEPLRRRDDALLADSGERIRGRDAERAERLVLRDLGDLEPQRAAVVHDETAVALEPGQHRAGVFGGVAMIARVRG